MTSARPDPRSRRCARPGCSSPAAATLSYEYRAKTVWIEALHPEHHPANHDLCARHADRLTPPHGWELVDRRAPRHQASRAPGGRDGERRAV